MEGVGARAWKTGAHTPTLQQVDHLLMLHSACRLQAIPPAKHRYDICPWPLMSLRAPVKRSYPADVAPSFSSCRTLHVSRRQSGQLSDNLSTVDITSAVMAVTCIVRRLSVLHLRLVVV